MRLSQVTQKRFTPSQAPQTRDRVSPSPQDAAFSPILDTVELSEQQRREPVPREAIEKAQKQLDKGDRGGAYLTLYKELGNEQILIQAQITTYTGIWGSGALAGNSKAQDAGKERYNLALDQFSTDIAQATIDGIRKDLGAGGTGRLTDQQFQAIDRQVWKDKKMGELFPGNVQFADFWSHEGENRGAFFSPSTVKMAGVAARSLLSVAGLHGGEMGKNTILRVGKRPAEYENNPNYQIHGSAEERFITVVDKNTGFVEAFWDNKPSNSGIPVPQLRNKPVAKDSPVFKQRNFLYDKLGANIPARESDSYNPSGELDIGWLLA